MRKLNEKKFIKENKGITLIALVIVVLVMIILAGVSIAMLSGNYSILDRTTDARIKTTIDREKELIDISYQSVVRSKTSKSDFSLVTGAELDIALKERGINVSVSGDNPIIVTFEGGNHYSVDTEGNVKLMP